MQYAKVVENKDCCELIQHIREMAEKDFADHVLKKKDGWWYCGKPGTSIYSFSLCLAIPYYVILVGDIDELVLFVTGRDPLAWLLGSIDSLDYVLGKARHPSKDFMRKHAEEAIKALEDEAKELEQSTIDPRYPMPRADEAIDQARELKERWEELICENEGRVCMYSHPEQLAWYQAWSEVINDGEPPECDYWSSQMLWQYFALCRFVELYRKEYL